MTKPNVDIGIFMHEERSWFQKNLDALNSITEHPFNLILVNESGTAHENINRVIDRSTADRLVIMDDDAQILAPDPNWLDIMMKTMDDDPRIGMLVPLEIKTEETLRPYLKDKKMLMDFAPRENLYYSWLPGYLMMFDRSRTPDIRADEGIPTPWGMSDLDLALQVRWLGFDCVCCTRFCVYHPWKYNDDGSIVEKKEWDEIQHNFMRDKWGEFFTDVYHKPTGTILDIRAIVKTK